MATPQVFNAAPTCDKCGDALNQWRYFKVGEAPDKTITGEVLQLKCGRCGWETYMQVKG